MRRQLVLVVAVFVTVLSACQREQSQNEVTIPIDADDIAGVVRSSAGVEAGVWVIAETNSLGTRFARIVVTDDEGRYVVPDLPDAEYQVWVRGYGLTDSVKVAARPGDQVDLIALVAPDAASAAAVYPAAYWYAMLDLPNADEVAEISGGMNQRRGATNSRYGWSSVLSGVPPGNACRSSAKRCSSGRPMVQAAASPSGSVSTSVERSSGPSSGSAKARSSRGQSSRCGSRRPRAAGPPRGS